MMHQHSHFILRQRHDDDLHKPKHGLDDLSVLLPEEQQDGRHHLADKRARQVAVAEAVEQPSHRRNRCCDHVMGSPGKPSHHLADNVRHRTHAAALQAKQTQRLENRKRSLATLAARFFGANDRFAFRGGCCMCECVLAIPMGGVGWGG